jgi:flavorubredoxin
MSDVFKAVKVTDRVWWVGAIDWALADFHGYRTGRGTTYNAYLVMGEKVTLIDTVKAAFKDEMMARIASVVDPSKVRYIISNHSEMDHSGALPATIARLKPEKVFASVMGVKALGEHFHGGDITAVKDGDKLTLGGVTFAFMETRMLHWPDSMMTYLPGEKLLFSQDGFGMHLASSERFDDEIDVSVMEYEAAKYYANIILPYSPIVTKALEKVAAAGLILDIIAPDHGPIWRRDVDRILGLYAKWAAQKPAKKAVVAYDTMWGSTALMAKAVAEGLSEGGLDVKVMRMAGSHRSDVITELLCAGAFVVGSPTMNNTIFPTMADLLCYATGLKPRNLVGAAFGSYGWSGESTAQLTQALSAMKVDLVGEGLKALYVPDEAALLASKKLGTDVAAKVREKTA